jgi:hypothetical protein
LVDRELAAGADAVAPTAFAAGLLKSGVKINFDLASACITAGLNAQLL